MTPSPADRRRGSVVALAIFLALLIGAVVLAARTQSGFGRIAVSNVRYANYNGIAIRAKLLKPVAATPQDPMPGIVYIHGYQNNRETGDAYCIELARRGFVVLNIDAIGRGNSGIPNDPAAPDFDPTYGGRSSLHFLKKLAFVDPRHIGLMGHSLGAEMAYKVALQEPGVDALVLTGFAYTQEATAANPRNMLMIIGRWDEYRQRMTGTRDIRKEWMSTPQSRRVIPYPDARIGKTYGDFVHGTARRVFVPNTIHIQESHSRSAIAETLEWMRLALTPPADLWIDPGDQIWPLKEWSTLIAMLACFATLLPFGRLLLDVPFFRTLRDRPTATYACPAKTFFKYATVNGLLMWLYLPLIFVLFGLHIYVVRIDKAFPMMMVNAVVWWFLWINIIGFFIFRRWYRKTARPAGVTLKDLGLSFQTERFALDAAALGKAALLAAILFAWACGWEYLLEKRFIVDFRFIFPFASDLTPYRARMFLVYYPYLLLGFVQLGLFLHGQLRPAPKATLLQTFAWWSLVNTTALVVPLLFFLAIQYVPLLTTGFIPFVGPGGMFVSFVMNLFHIIGVLVIVTPISTWFFQMTGKIYVGALLNAAIVTWMFTSSQVIAPIPI
jgi:pimeloyl-ACP methyl ester carboxylesterase